MDQLSYKTISVGKQSVEKKWWIVDAEGAVLGRLCSEVAKIVRGKHKPSYTPNTDCGDHVIIINADKVKLTGRKWEEKEHVFHTGYPGGQRIFTPRQLAAKSGALLVELALKGMLPKKALGRQVFKNVHVYAGSAHPHSAQQPTEIKLK